LSWLKNSRPDTQCLAVYAPIGAIAMMLNPG